MQQIKIYPVHSKDTKELDALYLRARKAFTWDLEKSPGDFMQHTQDEKVFVAWQHKTIVGFISIYEPENFIHLLFVDPNFSGEGIGQALLEYIIHHYPTRLMLKCVIENKHARNFYLKNNWKVVSQHLDEEPPYELMEYIH